MAAVLIHTKNLINVFMVFFIILSVIFRNKFSGGRKPQTPAQFDALRIRNNKLNELKELYKEGRINRKDFKNLASNAEIIYRQSLAA